MRFWKLRRWAYGGRVTAMCWLSRHAECAGAFSLGSPCECPCHQQAHMDEFIEAARMVAVNGSVYCGHIDPTTLKDRVVPGDQVVVPGHLWQRLHDAHLEAFHDG